MCTVNQIKTIIPVHTLTNSRTERKTIQTHSMPTQMDSTKTDSTKIPARQRVHRHCTQTAHINTNCTQPKTAHTWTAQRQHTDSIKTAQRWHTVRAAQSLAQLTSAHGHHKVRPHTKSTQLVQHTDRLHTVSNTETH